MSVLKKVLSAVLSIAMCVCILVGYASVVDTLTVSGSAQLKPTLPDVYITNITPESSAGVTVNATSGTLMTATVSGQGTATFTVEVKNISNKVYVYERTLDGAEIDVDGIYTGTDIKYEVSGISALDEVAPDGGTLTFTVTITVPRGVTADNYVLKFNFIEKTGTSVLPGNDEFKVTFKYNNGQADTSITVHKDDTVPRPATPSRAGFTFNGWYTDYACTNAWNFEIDRVKQDTILYAGWSHTAPTEYRVTFYPQNGEASYSILVKADTLISPPTAPVLEEYQFIGWYTDSACTNAWNFDTDKVRANMDLYGGWVIYEPPVPPEHYITFNPGNGDSEYTIMVLTGEFIPRPITPMNPGYVFIGWYTDMSYTTAWNFEVDKVDRDMTLYGGWDVEFSVDAVEYTITFNPNNGQSASTVRVEAGELIPRPQVPTRTGYSFNGWYTDSACTQGWNFDIDKPIADMTLYGGWIEAGDSSDGSHTGFFGLVEALLSTSNNCLNHSDVIFDAVMESWRSGKRPEEDAPIVHCSVNSVSGGTMSAIATFANSFITTEYQFLFEADPDPEYRDKRMRLYMYKAEDIEKAKTGEEITVYQQIVSKGSDGKWYADGTYVGVATVGNFFGGGKNGKDVKTISPYTWKFVSVSSDEI